MARMRTLPLWGKLKRTKRSNNRFWNWFARNLLQPVLTTLAKHDDHAMTWYDPDDSYLPLYDHGKIMVWLSWNIA